VLARRVEEAMAARRGEASGGETATAAASPLIRECHWCYTCGYGAAADVPQSIKAWMLMAIATWYENREALIAGQPVAELPRCFWEGLLDPFWVPGA
jgi:hypothetical protein